jgi:hypothetical protein
LNARAYLKSRGPLGLSIAVLLIGLLGLCGGIVTFVSERFTLFDVTACLSFAGLLVGVAAIVVSLRGAKAREAMTYAVLGVILSCPVAGVAGFVHLTAAQRRRFDEANTLKYNTVRLYEAMQNCAKSHEGRLPEAATWFDSLQQVNPALPDDEFRHPRDPGISVAYNAGLAGRRLTEIRADAVLFFEGMGGRNLAGGPELLPPTALREFVSTLLVKGTLQTYWVEPQGTHSPNYEFLPVRWGP